MAKAKLSPKQEKEVRKLVRQCTAIINSMIRTLKKYDKTKKSRKST